MIHEDQRYEISPFSVWVDDLKKSSKEIEAINEELTEQWETTVSWSGANDTAYSDYLSWNNLNDLDRFEDDVVAEASFEIVEGEHPTIDMDVVYGTIDWFEFYKNKRDQV